MNTAYELSPSVKEAFCSKMSEMTASLRKSVFLSQTELGALAGISRQTISQIERGEYKMSWNQFFSLLVVFSVNEQSCSVLREAGMNLECVAMFLRCTPVHSRMNTDPEAVL